MSETVHYKGYLEFIDKSELGLQDTCRNIIESSGFSVPKEYGQPSEYLRDYFKDEYYISKSESIYKVVVRDCELEEEDIFDVEEDSSVHGRLKFRLKYFNGVWSQDEALDEAFREYQEV